MSPELAKAVLDLDSMLRRATTEDIAVRRTREIMSPHCNEDVLEDWITKTRHRVRQNLKLKARGKLV